MGGKQHIDNNVGIKGKRRGGGGGIGRLNLNETRSDHYCRIADIATNLLYSYN